MMATIDQAAPAVLRLGGRLVPCYGVDANGVCRCKKRATCATPGKHPCITDWPNAASDAPEKIAEWGRAFPHANAGMAMGAGLLALDVDPASGGADSLRDLEREHGPLPRTPRQITGGGGEHYIFRVPIDLDLSNSAGEIAPGLDIRTDGGQVIVEPSRTNKGAYAWDTGAHPVDTEIADAPAWLLTLIQAPAKLRPATTITATGIPLGKAALMFVANGAPIHSQNNEAVKAARNYLSAGYDEEATAEALWRGLQASPWDPNRDPWTWEDARKIAHDIAASPAPPLRPLENGTVIVDNLRRNGHASAAPADGDTDDAPDAEGIADDHEAPTLPLLDAGDRQLPRIAAQSWKAINKRNSGPHLFRYGDVPTRIEAGGDGHPLLRAVTPDTLRFELARAATWYEDVTPARGGAASREAAAPPMDVVRDLLATPEPPLPVLRRLTTAPTFARDGSLHARRGFADGIFYTGGLEVPTIPERPTPTQIAGARDLLYELLHDFPFAQPSDRAHACGMCLQAFVRDLINGPTPLHLISAPAEGTGKGLLADTGCIVALGQQAAIMTEGRDADDWRKRVTSYLLMGHQAIQLDNLSRKLDAGSVAAALTSTTWTDRVLGGSTTARLPNTALWIATANNPNLSTEIARRCVRIRIDARSAHPNRRPASEFKHPDLRRWAHYHRPELVAACLTLVQAWIAAGRPVPTPTLGSFESWAEVIGGVLQVAGIEGFLDNADEFLAEADTDGNGWRAFVAEWWHLFCDEAVSVAMLYASVYNTTEFDALDFGGTDDKGRRTRLGRALGQQRDKVYGDWRITHTGTKQGIAQYRLTKVSDA